MAVYLARGSVLSLSFVEPNKPDRPTNPMNQLPATRREMLNCKTLFLPEILC